MSAQAPSLDMDGQISPSLLIQQSVNIEEPPKEATSGQDLYFELLELQPMQFTLSFMRTDRISDGDKYRMPPLSVFPVPNIMSV